MLSLDELIEKLTELRNAMNVSDAHDQGVIRVMGAHQESWPMQEAINDVVVHAGVVYVVLKPADSTVRPYAPRQVFEGPDGVYGWQARFGSSVGHVVVREKAGEVIGDKAAWDTLGSTLYVWGPAAEDLCQQVVTALLGDEQADVVVSSLQV